MSVPSATEERGEEVVSLQQAWKLYGSFAAVSGVTLALRRGEVHMLLGENGAGKSTIVGMLIGTHVPDRGALHLHGKPVAHYSPTAARRAGINAVLQDFSLAPALTVAENYFLGREHSRFGLLSKAQMRADCAAAIDRFGVELDVDAPVAQLSRGQQQLLEIVRALGGRPGALILDEPTATLSHEESERLFAIVHELKREGWAILYITHRLEEMRRLGDRLSVLRNGELVSVHAVADVSDEQLIREMVGRPRTTFYPEIRAQPGQVALRLAAVDTPDRKLKGVSLVVRAGEVVGIGGLIGCGKEEIGRVAFGLAAIGAGAIEFDGAPVHGMGPAQLLRKGIVYLPQDRRGEALALNRSIAENVVLEAVRDRAYSSAGFDRAGPLQSLVQDILRRLDVRPPNGRVRVDTLSGGNQQKVVLGRALSRARRLYIFDEPTAGIDVGARLDFYQQVKLLCEGGAAVLLITSDLQELIHLSHRVYVMHAGKVTAEVPREDSSEETIVRHAFGEQAVAA
jgi:ribose transport system ATP-binding protein